MASYLSAVLQLLILRSDQAPKHLQGWYFAVTWIQVCVKHIFILMAPYARF